MISIHTNLSSIITQNSLSTSTNKLNQAIERMTTGYKVNHAKDNAAGYSIITDMTTKLGAYQVAQDNCAQGLDLTTTASESLTLIEDRLQRLRSLAIQANNDTYGTEAKYAINAEANALVDEIGRVYCNTKYDDINLLGNAEKSKFIKDIIRRDTSEMTTLESVDINTALTSGTYSISTPQELAKLATMTNNGLVGQNTEFVLANDIDLSCYDNWTPIGTSANNNYFQASFDGNGYIVSNMVIQADSNTKGLFGYAKKANIKNLGIQNAKIISTNNSSTFGILIADIYSNTPTIIQNCYATGEIIATIQGTNSGGLIGWLPNACKIEDCWTNVNLFTNATNVGGMAGYAAGSIINSYAIGNVIGKDKVGGLVGSFKYGKVIDSYATGSATATNGNYEGQVVGYIDNNISEYSVAKAGTISNSSLIIDENEFTPINFQIGIGGDSRSQIDIDTGFSMIDFSKLKGIGLGSLDYLTMIDEFIDIVSQKQTELGAVQNRLESALDSIEVNIHNLTSSRSTLRDADIAKESARFVQEQILQEASATLLATANQTPAIALQLL